MNGEVSQHIEYFAFGETFVEEHSNTGATPYKFNAKELDDETGLYYYGARYYDPKTSVWASVDPLADFNPHMNSEHYINGQHNGGIFNSGNNNSYSYTYQNPLRFVDPNGKQVEAVYNKNNQVLTVADKKIWDATKPYKIVGPSEYKVGGVKDRNGNILYNQVMLVRGVFSGGVVDENGNISRDLNNTKQKPAPNGKYEILDNNADTNPNHKGWFRLDRVDTNPRDDNPGDGNSGIRWHLGGTSFGCVTLDKNNPEHQKAFEIITNISNTTNTETVKDRRGRQSFNPFSWRTKYGELTIKGEDKIKKK